MGRVIDVEKFVGAHGICVAVGGWNEGEFSFDARVVRIVDLWVLAVTKSRGEYNASGSRGDLGDFVPGEIVGLHGVEELNSAFGVPELEFSDVLRGEVALEWLADAESVAAGRLEELRRVSRRPRWALGAAKSAAYTDAVGCAAAVAYSSSRGFAESRRVLVNAVRMISSCLRRMNAADLRAFRKKCPARWSRLCEAEAAARSHGIGWEANITEDGALLVSVGSSNV